MGQGRKVGRVAGCSPCLQSFKNKSFKGKAGFPSSVILKPLGLGSSFHSEQWSQFAP